MIVTYMGVYLVSYLLASFHLYIPSGVLLMAEAMVLYVHEYRKTGHIVNVSGLYSLSLVGGQGISCLKLSNIQTDWEPMTWVCFFLAYVGFRAGTWMYERRAGVVYGAGQTEHADENVSIYETILQKTAVQGVSEKKDSGNCSRAYRRFFAGRHFSYKRFLILDCALAVAAWAAFALEAKVLGFIPFFVRGVPHAYSEFHVSGVHYFTVSVVLCPALSLIYFMNQRGHARNPVSGATGDADLRTSRGMTGTEGTRALKSEPGKMVAAIAGMAAALSGFVIPVLCVSRFQLVFALVLAVFVWMVMRETSSRISRRTLIKLAVGCVLVLIPAYVVLTKARSHDAEYLKGIFEMKKDYPIVFSHFYIYIANNFDNFDCMVKKLTSHTFGVRQLFPLWALTGLKFVFPQLVLYEYYLTKKELTTLTLFYDTYYDFGAIGVAVFAVVLGAVGKFLERKAFCGKDAGAVMLYGQFAIYMALAFFTTWFSNPTTWFYMGVTAVIYFLSWKKDPAAGVEIQEDNDQQ